MKRQLLYMLAPALLTAAGCSENTPAGGEEDGCGTLRVGCSADDIFEVRGPTTPGADDFAFELRKGDEIRNWKSVTAFNTENPLLVTGAYTATISAGDPDAEGRDLPCYAGSEQFQLKPRVQNKVQITAKISNSQALVRTTEQFRNYFHDALFTVATGSGNNFDFRFAWTTSASEPDSTEPVYVRAATTLTVTGTARRQSATGQDNGAEVTFAEQSLTATKPATRHIFEFDAVNAGTATLRIWLDDELTETVTVSVDLNEDANL